MMSNSSWMKASLQQPISVLFGEYFTTIGLLQQNEKSTQINQGKPWIRSPVVTARMGEVGY